MILILALVTISYLITLITLLAFTYFSFDLILTILDTRDPVNPNSDIIKS